MRRRECFVYALIITCLFSLRSVGNCLASEDTSLQNMLLRLKPAVVLVHTRIDAQVSGRRIGEFNFQPYITTGTGFIVSPDGYLVTNGHVVADYKELNDPEIANYFMKQLRKQLSPSEIEILDKYKEKITLIRQLHVILSNGDPFVAEVKEFSPPISPIPGKYSEATKYSKKNMEAGKDIAVLKIDARDLPTVPLGDSGNVQLGEQVYVIGYPGVVLHHDYLSEKTSSDSTVTMGHISGSKLDVKGTPVIQTDAALTWGNSGGPAFNSKGEVIGIATFISLTNNTGNTQAIQGFNFLVPSNTAMEFVRASGVNLGAESLFNKLWNEALDLYSIPDRDKTLSKIDEVNRIWQNLPDVKKLQLAAARMTPPKPVNSLQPIIFVALGVLLVGGIGFFIFRKGKKASVPSSAPSSAPTVAVSPKTKASVPPAMLKCTDGPLTGRTFPVTASGVKIGRDPSKNQIIIDDDGISREHATVVIENGKAVIRDLNSLNGTFIGSTDKDRIKSEVLKNGDVIIIGKGKFAAFTFSEG